MYREAFMLRCFLFSIFLSLAPSAWAASRIDLAFSRIHGLWIFMEALAGAPQWPPQVHEVYRNSTLDDARHRELIREFQDLTRILQTEAKLTGVEGRKNAVLLREIYLIQSGFAEDLNDLDRRTLGILPPQKQRRLMTILESFQPIN
jgi:hypothetical protein